MAWLCIFHAQGIAQDCISHGGLAAAQGWSASAEKLHLDSQGWLCWGEGILDVIGRQACRSLSRLYSAVLFGSVSPCVCVWKSCWLQTWAIIWSFEAGEEFPFSILLRALLGVWAWDSVLNWNEIKEFILGKNSFASSLRKEYEKGLKTELCGC